MSASHYIIALVISLGAGSAALGKCPKDGSIKVRLSADEFDLPGYDAERGVLAVRPTAVLVAKAERPRTVRLHLPK
jgi:hypothetical protein